MIYLSWAAPTVSAAFFGLIPELPETELGIGSRVSLGPPNGVVWRLPFLSCRTCGATIGRPGIPEADFRELWLSSVLGGAPLWKPALVAESVFDTTATLSAPKEEKCWESESKRSFCLSRRGRIFRDTHFRRHSCIIPRRWGLPKAWTPMAFLYVRCGAFSPVSGCSWVSVSVAESLVPPSPKRR